MTKQTKIIVGVVSVGVVLICITLFFLMPRGSDLTIQAPRRRGKLHRLYCRHQSLQSLL